MKSKLSIDVVEDLFKMSNELRQERENIIARSTMIDNTDEKLEILLNRDTTMKYNDQLDEVAQVYILFLYVIYIIVFM